MLGSLVVHSTSYVLCVNVFPLLLRCSYYALLLFLWSSHSTRIVLFVWCPLYILIVFPSRGRTSRECFYYVPMLVLLVVIFNAFPYSDCSLLSLGVSTWLFLCVCFVGSCMILFVYSPCLPFPWTHFPSRFVCLCSPHYDFLCVIFNALFSVLIALYFLCAFPHDFLCFFLVGFCWIVCRPLRFLV